MGANDHRTSGSTLQRWYCWYDMVLLYRHCWLYLRYALNGRDGKHGTYCVSLDYKFAIHNQLTQLHPAADNIIGTGTKTATQHNV